MESPNFVDNYDVEPHFTIYTKYFWRFLNQNIGEEIRNNSQIQLNSDF